MFIILKTKLAGVIRFCSNAAHRRALAIIVMLLASHFGLKEIDADTAEPVIGLILAALGAAWSPAQAPND